MVPGTSHNQALEGSEVQMCRHRRGKVTQPKHHHLVSVTGIQHRDLASVAPQRPVRLVDRLPAEGKDLHVRHGLYALQSSRRALESRVPWATRRGANLGAGNAGCKPAVGVLDFRGTCCVLFAARCRLVVAYCTLQAFMDEPRRSDCTMPASGEDSPSSCALSTAWCRLAGYECR